MLNPLMAFAISLVICLIWLRLVNWIVGKGWISSSTSRKVIHIGTGPIFLLCWPLFPEFPISKFLAAIIPFIIVVQLILINTGLLKDNSTINAMSRHNQKTELMKGPLFYGLIFTLVTIFFWKKPEAVISLMMLCGGDGFADLFGSNISSWKLPWSKNKTLVGSLAMFAGGFLFSFIILEYFSIMHLQQYSLMSEIIKLVIISLIATIVESITPSDYDNITVPVISILSTVIFF